MMPCAFSKPAGLITLPIEAETLLRKCSGFQPISAIFLIACAANFGVVKLKKTSAPDDLQLDDVGVDGRLGDFVASSATIIVAALAPRPSFRPFR